MIERLRRLLFVLSADFPTATRRARLRVLWHTLRGYDCELCQDCGRRVGPHTGSWWSAPDEMWRHVVGRRNGVLCPPCFTDRAWAAGFVVYWTPIIDAQGTAHACR